MRHLLRAWLGLTALLVALAGAEALAQRKPQEFREPKKMTEEQLEAAKARSRTKLNGWTEKDDKPLPPFPWRAAALAGLCILGATPFAVRAYVNMARELAARRANASARRDDVEA